LQAKAPQCRTSNSTAEICKSCERFQVVDSCPFPPPPSPSRAHASFLPQPLLQLSHGGAFARGSAFSVAGHGAAAGGGGIVGRARLFCCVVQQCGMCETRYVCWFVGIGLGMTGQCSARNFPLHKCTDGWPPPPARGCMHVHTCVHTYPHTCPPACTCFWGPC
jgi:hypothetical protein